ncbi:unnamed protein product, partial [Effrenium voratum]
MAPQRSLLKGRGAPRHPRKVGFAAETRTVPIESFGQLHELWFDPTITAECNSCHNRFRWGKEAILKQDPGRSGFASTEVLCRSCQLSNAFEKLGGWFIVLSA